MAETKRLRIGILGAARGVPISIIEPLRKNPDLAKRVEVAAIAAKDTAEADDVAKKWGIPKAYASLEELLLDPTIDAVYNVLPNNMRCQWTVNSLMAGKHTLCETPYCSNVREAVVLQRAAEDAGKVCLEGLHPTHNPLWKRTREMVNEGKVGTLERIEMSLPLAFSIMGTAVCSKVGALLGLGSYCVGLVRAITGEEPRVSSASAKRSREIPEVDEEMVVDLTMPSGATARFSCSTAQEGKVQSQKAQLAEVVISGSNGVIRSKEWFGGTARAGNTITIEQFDGCGTTSVETVPGSDSSDTFYYQLMAFCDEIKAQSASTSIGMPWDYTSGATPADAARSMAVIDSIYSAAGMAAKSTAFPPAAPYDRIGQSKL